MANNARNTDADAAIDAATDTLGATTVDVTPLVSDDDLAGLKSFQDVADLVMSRGGAVLRGTDEMGNGFVPCDKASLIDKPFIVARAIRSVGDDGAYWTLNVVTTNDEKVVFSDGGTGIAASLDRYVVKRQIVTAEALADGWKGHVPQMTGIVIRGLRKSDYKVTGDDGKVRSATTFYLNV